MQANDVNKEAFRKAMQPQREEAVKEYGPKAKDWIERVEAIK